MSSKNEYFNQSILYFDDLSIFWKKANHLSSTNRYEGFFYNDFANAERGPGVVVGGFASFAKGRKFGEAGTS